MSMGQVCLIVLAVVVGLAMILYLSCLLLFRTGTETAFHFAEPELTLKPSSNPTVMAMCAMLEQGTRFPDTPRGQPHGGTEREVHSVGGGTVLSDGSHPKPRWSDPSGTLAALR